MQTIEAQAKELRAVHLCLQEAERGVTRIEGGQRQMARDHEQERVLMVAEHAEAIEKLQKDLAAKPVADLAARTRAKVVAKYGLPQREMLEGLIVWLWDSPDTLLVDLDATPVRIVNQYLESRGG